MNWNDAKASTPPDLRPCVVLVRDVYGFWERQFAQCNARGEWSYMGADAKIRGVEFWCDLPALPRPLIGGARE